MAVVVNPLQSKKSKTSVDYKLGYKCGNCIYFLTSSMGMSQGKSADGNRCRLVEGNISPEAVCNLWEGVESSGPYDKSFYLQEYTKESNGQ